MAKVSPLREQAGTNWSKQRWTLHKILAHGLTDTDAGQWVSLEGVHPVMVTFEGDFAGGTATLLGSCYKPALPGDPAFPPDSDSDKPVQATPVTGPANILIDGPFAFLKVVYARTASETPPTGELFAYVYGVERPGT